MTISTDTERTFSKLLVDLIKRIYQRALETHRYWSSIPPLVKTESTVVPPIYSPRYISPNKRFWREHRYDATPEEYREYASKHLKALLTKESDKDINLPELPLVSEWMNVINFIKNHPDSKLNDIKLIEEAIGNFCIDVLSCVKGYSNDLPKYANNIINNKLHKLIDDMFSNEINITIIIPLINFSIETSKFIFKTGFIIKQTKEDFPLFVKLHHDFILSFKMSIQRDIFNLEELNINEELSKDVDDILLSINLYKNSYVDYSLIVFELPYFEIDGYKIINRKNPLYTDELIINKNDKNKFMKFIKKIYKKINIYHTYKRINISYIRYRSTFENNDLEYQILDLAIGFEALLGIRGRETGRWISLRTARLLGSLTNDNPVRIFNDMLLLYAARNTYVHQGSLPQNFRSNVSTKIPTIKKYLRKSIICLLFILKNESYDTTLSKLDAFIEHVSIPSNWISLARNEREILRY